MNQTRNPADTCTAPNIRASYPDGGPNLPPLRQSHQVVDERLQLLDGVAHLFAVSAHDRNLPVTDRLERRRRPARAVERRLLEELIQQRPVPIRQSRQSATEERKRRIRCVQTLEDGEPQPRVVDQAVGDVGLDRDGVEEDVASQVVEFAGDGYRRGLVEGTRGRPSLEAAVEECLQRLVGVQ